MHSEKNHVYLVTGGASGIGRALVEILTKHKGFVYFIDIDDKSGKELEKRLTNCRFIYCDISDDAQVESVFKIIKNEKGKLNAVINCAAIAFYEMLATKKNVHSSKRFEKMNKINLYGTFNVSRFAARFMIETKKQGEDQNIVNFASILGHTGTIGSTAYSATKGAMMGMTLPLARDLGKYGIRVNCICPGLIETPMSKDQDPKQMRDSSPLKQVGKPEHIAQATISILENSFINGANINVDGGALTPYF